MSSLLIVFQKKILGLSILQEIERLGLSIDRYWILASGYWIKQGMPFLIYPASSIQHLFVSSNVLFIPSTRRFEAELR